MDVEIVRGWNVDMTSTWGKTGHFKIGAKSCELISNKNLRTLLMANQKNIGYTDDDLKNAEVVPGKFTRDFVPLADVADIIWRTTRPSDESNHFADVDETNPRVMAGKSLLQLSLSDDKNIGIDFWLNFDKQMDTADPVLKRDATTGNDTLRPRRGALPFRVWQMYNQMITSVMEKDLTGFIVAGGTMSHYVGDASQPLHIFYLHHGRNPGETNVHSDYETTMINKKMAELFMGVNQVQQKVRPQSDLIGKHGKEAAKRVLQLDNTIKVLPPLEVVTTWANANGIGKWDKMWNELGQKTIQNIAEGARVMAIFWESAWENGNGNHQFKKEQLTTLNQDELKTRYMTKTFVPSFGLENTEAYKKICI